MPGNELIDCKEEKKKKNEILDEHNLNGKNRMYTLNVFSRCFQYSVYVFYFSFVFLKCLYIK